MAMEFLTTVGSAASVASFAGQSTKLLKHITWTKIKNFFKCPAYILVLGETGNGKTHLIHSIIGRTIDDKERTSDIKEYSYKIPLTGRRVIFVDTPGNDFAKRARTEEEKKIYKNKYVGIINVVAYGYRWAEDNKLEDIFEIDKEGNTIVKESFLLEGRKNEIHQMKEWLNYVNDSKVSWVLTVINKADVWSDEERVVHQHYRKELYHTKIDKLNKDIPYSYVSYCCCLSPFGGKIRPSLFGESNKAILNNHFMYTLIDLLENKRK